MGESDVATPNIYIHIHMGVCKCVLLCVFTVSTDKLGMDTKSGVIFKAVLYKVYYKPWTKTCCDPHYISV